MTARVLIVEDERELAELVHLYLQKDGIDSVIAESAEAGFHHIENKMNYQVHLKSHNLSIVD